jgi:monothiol glutaredoxin
MSLSDATQQKIASLVASDRVVLFMKGTPESPQCGFSAEVVRILDSRVPTYMMVDVLADPALRDGIRAFSSRPTIPELYIEGGFIGGRDTREQLYPSGELEARLWGSSVDVV